MDIDVDVMVECDAWDAAQMQDWAEGAAREVLGVLGLCGAYEVAILACDDARIAVLNEDFRAKPTPTNVLSWPAQERGAAPGERPLPPVAEFAGMPIELGDIAIAQETCAREAQAQGKDFAAHVRHLLVHGFLHLLGYDHIDDKDAALMEGLEVEILGKMGISDPYVS